MKIGIFTQPIHTNYGGILQAFALQTVLEQRGHKVKVIKLSLFRPLFTFKTPFSLIKRGIKKYIMKKECRIFEERYFNKSYPITGFHTLNFINKYIHLVDFNTITPDMFDAIVVGSDQVWRPKINRPIERSFLNFTTNWNIIRIAYAASFGTDEWEFTKEQTKNCKELIKYFNAVSVREDSGIDLCKTKLDVEAIHVLDPTMLLEKETYIKLFYDAPITEKKGDLLTYILDETEEKNDIIQKVSNATNFIPFRVNSRIEDSYAPIKERVQPPVEQWISGFYNAKFVVTDSFHGCVFSIIFNKPFIVYANIKRGNSRIESLLKIFALENRLINSIEMIDDKLINSTIDWAYVNKIKQIWREKSINFLESGLSQKTYSANE